MCEKIGGYKTFAHMSVCHSTRLSEAGFILSTAWHLHRSIADEASHDSNYILLADQPKSRAAAKMPLFTRVEVARQNWSLAVSYPPAPPSAYRTILRHTPRSGPAAPAPSTPCDGTRKG